MSEIKPQIKLLTLLMCVFNFAGAVFYSPELSWTVNAAIFAPVFAFTFFALWKFYNGQEWARILVLITSGLALLNLIFILGSAWYQKIVIGLEALLGIYLLYFLNLSKTKSYFNSRP